MCHPDDFPPFDCALHGRVNCTLCDECGHESARHANAHELPEPARSAVFARATCWAENLCAECAPTADGCPNCGWDLDVLGGNPACETCAAEPALV